MPKAKNVKYIVIHCSAGWGDVDSIKRFWKETLKWRSVGYHRFIDDLGKVHKLAKFSEFTNGVKGWNGECIHISYQGGVEKNNVNKARDTRTYQQKHSIIECINEALDWLESEGVNTELGISVVGHRDFSPDRDGSGVIESWERIKECPSFDAIEEYKSFTSPNMREKLPKK